MCSEILSLVGGLFIFPCLWFILWYRNFKFWCKCSQIHSSFPQILQTGSSVILLLTTFLQSTPREGQPSLLKNFLFSSCTFFFWLHYVACGVFPDQGSNLCCLHWECRVLTTGLPEKSCTFFF